MELRYGATVVTSPLTTARDGGAYYFESVCSRQLHGGRGRLRLPSEKISTSPSEVTLTVGSEPVIVNFGVAQKRTVSGVVFDDLNDNGKSDTGEEIAATVKVIQDTDRDGLMDYGEPVLGQDHTGQPGQVDDGRYTVDNIPPGYSILTVVPDLGGYAGAPVPMFLSAIPVR